MRTLKYARPNHFMPRTVGSFIVQLLAAQEENYNIVRTGQTSPLKDMTQPGFLTCHSHLESSGRKEKPAGSWPL